MASFKLCRTSQSELDFMIAEGHDQKQQPKLSAAWQCDSLWGVEQRSTALGCSCYSLTWWVPNPHQHINERKRAHQSLAGFALAVPSVWWMNLTPSALPPQPSSNPNSPPHFTGGSEPLFPHLFKSSGLCNEYYQQTAAHKFLSTPCASPHLWQSLDAP